MDELTERATAPGAPPSVPPAGPHVGSGGLARGSFTGAAGAFFRILLIGTLLLIPTLGFYRFWLITDIRRHLWANTRIGDEPFEYIGTAKEILIGFLVAMAILVPVYVLYFLIGIESERLKAFASLPLVGFLYAFGQYATFRARRYRATRTIFRGLRFWMSGSAWAYAGRAFVWDLLTLLTVGLAYPWRAAALERYKMRNTHFGDLAGEFVATGGQLFKRGVWLWLAGMVSLGLIVAGSVAAATKGRGETVQALPLLLLLVGAIVFPLFWAIQVKWYMNGYRFGGVSIQSSIRKRTLIGRLLLTFAGIAGFAIGFALLIGLIFLVVGLGATSLSQDLLRGDASSTDVATIAAIVTIALLYLLFILGIGLIKRLILDRGVWKVVVDSLTLTNVEMLDRVVAAGPPPVSGFGEGLADALDVGAI